MRAITKAVFPVAGLGTRFLPATKASPKEMLPVVDKPLIQYAVEEAAAAGISDMIFITGRNKRSIEDHFDKAYELETELELRNKTELLQTVQSATPRGINCIYIRQTEALGLGHAVLCAAPVVGDEPFAVILADDLIDARVPVMQQMVEVARAEDASAIGVMEVPADDVDSWGIVETRSATRPDGADHSDRREAKAGDHAVDARGRRPLCSDTADLSSFAHDAAGRRRRDPADRRHRPLAGRGKGRGLPVRRPALRLRTQAGLPRGDGGFRAQASGSRGGIRGLPARAAGKTAPMTLSELRYIVAVANERSFGRAARRCFVSQPALSVAIQKLEEELGARLFERGKSEITVTPVGARVVEQAQKVLEEATRVQELAQAGRNQLAGVLKLGVIYTIAPYLLPDLIPALHAHAPQMPLDLDENLTENLGGRAAVGPHRHRDPRAAVRAAGCRHRIPVRGAVSRGGPGRPQMGEAQSIRPDELAGERPILLDIGHCFRDAGARCLPRVEPRRTRMSRGRARSKR